jgi:hypothetical protein
MFSDERHRTYIRGPLNVPLNTANQGKNTEVFKHLSKGLKQMGEAAEHSNTLKREEIILKEKEEEKKKDRIKDTHPLISNMIRMASTASADHIGNFFDSFKAFYNSKNQGYTDLELHNQFKVKSLHIVGFGEGAVLALWWGLLRRSNPMAPSNCTPFAFKELLPINMNQKLRSQIVTMINQKSGLSQSAEEIKAKAKQDIAAPSNYHPTQGISCPQENIVWRQKHCHQKDQGLRQPHRTKRYLLRRLSMP